MMEFMEIDTKQAELTAAIERLEYNLVVVLNPRVFIDGKQWCVLYGENLAEGIAGFGDTPYAAVLDFNKAWTRKIGQGQTP